MAPNDVDLPQILQFYKEVIFFHYAINRNGDTVYSQLWKLNTDCVLGDIRDSLLIFLGVNVAQWL